MQIARWRVMQEERHQMEMRNEMSQPMRGQVEAQRVDTCCATQRLKQLHGTQQTGLPQ